MDGYKIFLVIPIAIIVIVFVTIGIPSLQLFVGLPDYDLSVDARTHTENSLTIGEVLIQNTGSQPLTNIKVNFGEGDILDLGTLKARHKVILTPPPDNKMESVTVSADHDIFVNVVYAEDKLIN